MNRLATMAAEHWATHRPDELAKIPEQARQAHFQELADEAQAEVETLAESLAGPDPTGEPYLAKVGRLREARAAAEAQVIREMILPGPVTPEPSTQDAETLAPEPAGTPAEQEFVAEIGNFYSAMDSLTETLDREPEATR